MFVRRDRPMIARLQVARIRVLLYIGGGGEYWHLLLSSFLKLRTYLNVQRQNRVME